MYLQFAANLLACLWVLCDIRLQVETAMVAVVEGFSHAGNNYAPMGMGSDLSVGGRAFNHVVDVVTSQLPEHKKQLFVDAISTDKLLVSASYITHGWTPDHYDGVRKCEKEIRIIFLEVCIMRILFSIALPPITMQWHGSEDAPPQPAPAFNLSRCSADLDGQLRMACFFRKLFAKCSRGMSWHKGEGSETVNPEVCVRLFNIEWQHNQAPGRDTCAPQPRWLKRPGLVC